MSDQLHTTSLAAEPATKRRASYLAVALALTALQAVSHATIISAQAKADEPKPVQTADTQLEKIVVTAQRREQELQSVPIPVSTFTARDLELRNITNTLKVGEFIPNMVAQNNTGLGTANVYFIRALGNTESIATFDPPVGTYVNDIYVSRQNANNFSFFDVERIEVLRGPQGTLFGRNTTGGAMNIILRKPGRAQQGYLEVGGGSFGSKTYRGSVDVPLSDNFFTKFSYYYVNDRGYVRNITTGRRVNDQDSQGYRGAFLWRLQDGFSWNLAADATEDNGLSLYNGDDNGTRISKSGLRNDASAGGVNAAGAPRFSGEKNNYGLGNRVKSKSVSSTVNVLWGATSIDFITGWRDMTQKYAIDFGNTPVSTGGFTILNDARHKQFSQELKAAGEIGQLSYVAGAFYMDEKNNTDFGDLFNLAFSGGANVPLVLADRVLRNTTKSKAVYAQGDFKLNQQFTATLGLRYTDDKKEVGFADNRTAAAPAAQLTTANMQAAGIPTAVSTKLATPRAAIAYQSNPDLMLFASATRGFKSGGWNARGTSAAVLTPFGIEKVWSYEAGWRMSLANNTVRFNGTMFRSDVKDLQTSSAFISPTGAVSFIIQNFAGLKNQGIELELNAQPMRGLNTYINVGLQDAKYVDIAPAISNQQAECRASIASGAAARPRCLQGIVNAAGEISTPVRAPKVSVSPGVTYTTPTLWSNVRAAGSLNLSYQSRAVAGTAENAFAESHTVVNASIGLLGGQAWKLAADCSNCTDKKWFTASLAGLNYLNDPRRYSLKLNHTFR